MKETTELFWLEPSVWRISLTDLGKEEYFEIDGILHLIDESIEVLVPGQESLRSEQEFCELVRARGLREIISRCRTLGADLEYRHFESRNAHEFIRCVLLKQLPLGHMLQHPFE